MITYLLIGAIYTLADTYCTVNVRKVPVNFMSTNQKVAIYLLSVLAWPIDLVGSLVLVIKHRM